MSRSLSFAYLLTSAAAVEYDITFRVCIDFHCSSPTSLLTRWCTSHGRPKLKDVPTHLLAVESTQSDATTALPSPRASRFRFSGYKLVQTQRVQKGAESYSLRVDFALSPPGMCPDAARTRDTLCVYPGCTSKVWKDPDGSFSLFCGLTHRNAMAVNGGTLTTCKVNISSISHDVDDVDSALLIALPATTCVCRERTRYVAWSLSCLIGEADVSPRARLLREAMRFTCRAGHSSPS